jgi:cell division protein FtsW (lipid II flippase)
VDAERPGEFEPADRPVQWYETAVCIAAQFLTFLSLGAHNRVVELAAGACIALLVIMSLWKLLVPPRFSATRGAFVLLSLICVWLLIHPWVIRETSNSFPHWGHLGTMTCAPSRLMPEM